MTGSLAGHRPSRCAMMRILLVHTHPATTTERIAKILIGTSATGMTSVAQKLAMVPPLRIGSTAGKRPNRCAMMRIPLAHTHPATTMERTAKIQRGSIATTTTVKEPAYPMETTKTSKTGLSAI